MIQPPAQTPSLSPPAPNPRRPGDDHVGFHHPHALARHRSAAENHHAPPKLAKLRANRSAPFRQTKNVGVSLFICRLSCPPKKNRSNFCDRSDPPSVVKRGRLLCPAKYKPARGLAGRHRQNAPFRASSNNHRFSRKSRRSACPAPRVRHRRSTSSCSGSNSRDGRGRMWRRAATSRRASWVPA